LENNESLINYYNSKLDLFKKYLIENFVEKKTIHFIFNSEHCKNMFVHYLKEFGISIEDNRLIVIYNILYEEEFISIKNKHIPVLKNQLVYASAWQKGIEDIISIFEYILQKDSSYILILMHPGYGMEIYENYKKYLLQKFPNNIVIKDSLSKDKYSEIIKESLCVLSSRFNETFGCVFAESYYLGTPVIADIGSGAVKEIIDNYFIVNYNNKEQVFNKIKEISYKRDHMNIKLPDKFLFNENFNKWKSILQ
jgi:glycosyltransferase involved in cell wall biosynthesis